MQMRHDHIQQTVQGASELDCLQQVYNDEATATIYDQ